MEEPSATSESQEELAAARLIGTSEPPPYLLWPVAYLVGLLLAGSFFLTGLFLTFLMKWESTFAGGVFTGLLPGAVSGGVMTGLVYAVYPKWTGKAVGVSLFGIAVPLVAIPFAFGLTSAFAVAFAPLATVAAGLLIPKVIRRFRQKGVGKVKAPKGSWEDNF
ncbi:MAG: hypothetical protein JNM28_12275 [Armatimonadetes bacterium]|nr:hypothetical protein [Armatimonadota bacterium]MBS1710194.1 hypothetical protein [Armatimonadota bacterium]MBX3110084.1 hypothetical protein [Fimbriimonadaceae bacterium]